jgi:hypothetical protein
VGSRRVNHGSGEGGETQQEEKHADKPEEASLGHVRDPLTDVRAALRNELCRCFPMAVLRFRPGQFGCAPIRLPIAYHTIFILIGMSQD